nr:hypothetical protein [Tanacetum cinerariifolium]
ETRSTKRSYDVVNCKWKTKIRPKVSQFCDMNNSVLCRHEVKLVRNENIIYQKGEKSYRAFYKSNFQLVECWNILKGHKKWKKAEYPKYLRGKYRGSKKSRTSESISDLTHIGLNLNDEAADSGDEEIKESRLMGRDKTKRMRSTSAARLASSAAADTDQGAGIGNARSEASRGSGVEET